MALTPNYGLMNAIKASLFVQDRNPPWQYLHHKNTRMRPHTCSEKKERVVRKLIRRALHSKYMHLQKELGVP